MAFPWAAIAGGASGSGGGIGKPIFNAWMTQKQNIDSTKWNEEMYKWQMADQERLRNQQWDRDDRLWDKETSYNEKMWQKQNEYNEGRWKIENEYNSPQAQMERFKAAGLNPALIYGQGNMGGSVSAANFDNARHNSSGGLPNARAGSPQLGRINLDGLDLASGIMSYMDLNMKQAQLNNLEETNKMIRQSTILKGAETNRVLGLNEYNEKYRNSLADMNLDSLRASLRKTNIEADLSLHRDEREKIMNQLNLRRGNMSLKEATERILNMRGERLNKEADTQLKNEDLKLKQQGINPSDWIWWRKLGTTVNEISKPYNTDGKFSTESYEDSKL